ncbi:MAG: hypothetical protein IPL88_07590 [Rhizobiales bacterium]|nr:hypothetical protein [Hyphomicrobiales bacterium]
MTGKVAMKKIALSLARTKERPEGSDRDGYTFVAPLNEGGRIDLDMWKAERGRCFVHRIRAGAVDERGLLVHRPGGRGGATWAFDYDNGSYDEEEEGYRFGDHAFTPGEYVSIRDEDGVLQTYRVTGVTPA